MLNSKLQEVTATFFWYGTTPLKAYCRTRSTTTESKKGLLIGVLTGDQALPNEKIYALGKQFNKNVERVLYLLNRKSSSNRYLVVFPESQSLHVYYQDQLGDILTIHDN